MGLAGADAAKEGAEVVRLKRLGEQRMARGHIEWALDTYEAAAALAPKDRGIRHALAMLRSLIDSRRSRHDPESYLDQLVVDGIRVEGPQIQGEVRNTGPLPLDQIELRVLGLDPKGNAVVQMTRQLSDVALMPGGRLRFEVAFDTPPKTWKGAVEVRVIRVRFRASEP
ncbi:MAG: FxLYD domain-containing protein [Myxococcota bacterium]